MASKSASPTLLGRFGLSLKPRSVDVDGLSPIVLITGASEGIGYALASQFACKGHDIMMVARSAGTLAEAATRIREQSGRAVYEVVADLTTTHGLDAIDEALAAKRLHVHILVNNAGVGYGGEFVEQPAESMRQLLDLNILATSELIRRHLPGMVQRGEGGVLNIGSLGGFFPGPYQAAYYASKAYMRSLTNAVAQEVRGKGVRISLVAPGPVMTNFHHKAGVRNSNYLKTPGGVAAERVARSAYFGFLLWRRTIVPGGLPLIASVFSRMLPNFIITPFIGWLLKKRL